MIHELLPQYQKVIFDLDNTIYDEFVYIDQLFRGKYKSLEISRYVGLNTFIQEVKNCYQCWGNNKLLQRTYENLGMIDSELISKDLAVLRNNTPLKHKLKRLNWFNEILISREKKFNFYIITNGNPYTQEQKINCLGLNSIFPNKNIIFANLTKPKPSTDCILNYPELRNDQNTVLMLGDSLSDQKFASALGWDYLHVTCKRNDNGYYIEETIQFVKK